MRNGTLYGELLRSHAKGFVDACEAQMTFFLVAMLKMKTSISG